MGSSHEGRPQGQQPSPFDSAAGAATQKVGSATGSGQPPSAAPSPAMGPIAGAGPGSATPFLGLYDSPAPTPSAGTNDPHVTLFTGITAETQDAKDIAAKIDPNAGSYAGYDGTIAKTSNPGGLWDHLFDATAVLTYSQIGNQVDLTPARDASGKIQYDANGNVKYDIDYGMFGGSEITFMPEDYQSAQKLGQQGADAVLHPPNGDTPGKTEPITVDAHSGGGQTAFFTALELYQKGYSDINIVGFDMAMTPEQRETLEKLGVDVSNTTTHINFGSDQYISPVGGLIQWAMGGSDEKYYDKSLELGYGDVFTTLNPLDLVTRWHEFHHNDTTLDYMKQQNAEQSATKPGKARPDLFSSDINLKEKSASVDIGGPKGLGAYVNLSEGQLDLNVFGNHVDIDQGVRNVAKTVTRAVDKAKDLGQDASEWVQDKWQAADTWVQDKAQTASTWVQDKTQSASTWVQDKTQAAGDWLQGTTSAVGNWLFGGNQSAGGKAGQAMSSGALGGAKAGAGSQAGQAMSSGALGGAKAGAGSSASPVTGSSGGAAKPTASKAAGGKGTVVTAPKEGAGGATASVSKTGGAGKAADDVAGSSSGKTGGTSGGKSATQIPAGTAPKSDPGKSASASKTGGATAPKSPTNSGKAADDVAPKSSSGSKPAKSSSKVHDDPAPKHSTGGSRGRDDRFRHS